MGSQKGNGDAIRQMGCQKANGVPKDKWDTKKGKWAPKDKWDAKKTNGHRKANGMPKRQMSTERQMGCQKRQIGCQKANRVNEQCRVISYGNHRMLFVINLCQRENSQLNDHPLCGYGNLLAR
jgi:hypothetical protein